MKTIEQIRQECASTKILVVSKNRSIAQMQPFYEKGVRTFGENRVDQLQEKVAHFPDAEFHFIGHLQRNKAKAVVPYVTRVSSVASLDLCKILEKECTKLHKDLQILVEVNISQEPQKYGIQKEEVASFLQELVQFPHLHCVGFMVMAPDTENQTMIHDVFSQAEQLFLTFRDEFNLTVLSMGMSQDYPIALQHGSTEVRLGSILF